MQRLLERKIAALAAWLSDPSIVAQVSAFNSANRSLTDRNIRLLDRAWIREQGRHAFANAFLTNAIALRLAEYRAAHPDVAEIFITDARGLVIALINPTSDYNQADEDWWIRAFDGGRGRATWGGIEYDESSRTRALSVFVPVTNAENGTAIGVCKAVLDLEMLGRDL